jgi:hypothetical protein
MAGNHESGNTEPRSTGRRNGAGVDTNRGWVMRTVTVTGTTRCDCARHERVAKEAK